MAVLAETLFGSQGKGGSVGNEECMYSFLMIRNVLLALMFSVTMSELTLMFLLMP